MENSSEQATIAIVDDHPIYRQGLASVFRAEARFKVVAEGASTADALDIAKTHRPSILVLDLGIPGDSLETLKQLCVEFPGTHCVILTACDDPQTGIAALNAGAHGYILKGVSASELKAAIWAVFKNESSFVSPEFAARLLSAVQQKEATSIDVGLSHRELQIIAEVESGRHQQDGRRQAQDQRKDRQALHEQHHAEVRRDQPRVRGHGVSEDAPVRPTRLKDDNPYHAANRAALALDHLGSASC
ncbi:DNA-binding NarL/FixJ family response regulator [Bradyrhizobium sp. GM22.5]